MFQDTKALTGLRGAAAISVMMYHLLDMDPIDPSGVHLFRKGYLAVDLFFCLSGFVLAMNHGAAFREHIRAADLLVFARKRLARIYPAYLAVLGLLLWLASLGAAHLPLGTVAANVLALQKPMLLPSLIGPSWSVSAEMAAYALFPVIAATMLGRGAFFAACAIAASFLELERLTGLSAAALAQTKHGPLDIFAQHSIYPVARCLCGFIAGVAAFRLCEDARVQRLLETRVLPEALLAVLVALSLFSDADVAIVGTSLMLICSLCVADRPAARLLSSGPALFLGELSYSLYLVHLNLAGLVRDAVSSLLPPSQAFVLSGLVIAALALAFAYLLHIFIERPARRWLLRPRVAGRAPRPSISS